MQVKLFFKLENVTLELMEDLAVFYFEFILSKMLLPGKVETWYVILDFDDVGVFDLPKE